MPEVPQPKKRMSTFKIVMVSCSVLTLLVFIGAFLAYRQYSSWRSNPYWDVDYQRVFRQACGLETKNLGDIEKNQSTFSKATLLELKGMMADHSGQTDVAIDHFKQALDEFEAYPGWNNPYAFDCMDRLADNLDKKGLTDEAEKMHKSAIVCAEKAGNKKSCLVANALKSLAVFYDRHGKPESSEKTFREALAVDKAGLCENSEQIESDYWWIGNELMSMSNFHAAHENLERARRIAATIGRDQDLGDLEFEQGRCAYYLRDFPQSIEHFKEADRRLGEKSRNCYESRLWIATAISNQGNKSAADAEAESAVPKDGALPPGGATARAYYGVAMYFEGRNNLPRAEMLHRQVLEAMKKDNSSEHDRSVMHAESQLANCLLRENKIEESAQLYKEMLALSHKVNEYPPDWVRVQAIKAFTLNNQPELAKSINMHARYWRLPRHAKDGEDDDRQSTDAALDERGE